MKCERICVVAPCLVAFPVALGLSIFPGTAASAKSPARCHAEVIRSEELPYAPIGSWLLKATVRVRDPHGQTVAVTLVRSTPWQTTLRRGQTFWLDCDRLRDTWPASLQSMR